ncbi:cis-prenyltransferase [Trypanosoma grayi]|uniref:cis-prenyltransferase n=1 Tax=Trypanosoma grayi TaxID=71804 RepID=UPI0004F4B915|nr:cis-prenyltransferase [Trypanosoma grayi]KEG13972.1 cis-prenyltransferase [Trypanosoma grayi]
MQLSASLEDGEMSLMPFLADGDATLLVFQHCMGGTLDTLTEGFEMFVVFFCAVLFFACLACASWQWWHQAAVRIIPYCFKKCGAVVDPNKEEGCFNLRTYSVPEEKSHGSPGGPHLAALKPCCTTTGVPNHGVRHLAVIMDGNRRYGKRTSPGTVPADAVTRVCESIFSADRDSCKRDETYTSFMSLLRRTPLDGHRRGGEKLMEFIDYCLEYNIQMLTVYAFSTENWDRPPLEVNVLMALFFFYFERIRQSSKEKGIFIRFISPAFERIMPCIRELMVSVEEESRKHVPRRIVVNVCVSYSGREEILNACNRLARRVNKSLLINNEDFMKEMLRSVTQDKHDAEDASVLADSGGAEPQVLLRTSGEQRLSNFLLFECAYTEFFFCSKTWPEVTKDDLARVLYDYSHRNRRQGK